MLQPSSRSPYKSRSQAPIGEAGGGAGGGAGGPEGAESADRASRRAAVSQRSAAKIAADLDVLTRGKSASKKKRRKASGEEAARKRTRVILGTVAFAVAIFAMQWVLPSGGSKRPGSKSSIESILRDVGHVVQVRKGHGIER